MTITVTDSERVVWSGSYRAFQQANLDSLSVTEWESLHTTGTLEVGGGAAPHFVIQLHKEAPTVRP